MLSATKEIDNSNQMEPILMPNEKRFVLFPIEYPEVINALKKSNEIGLANVQKSRGLLLDSRRS